MLAPVVLPVPVLLLRLSEKTVQYGIQNYVHLLWKIIYCARAMISDT